MLLISIKKLCKSFNISKKQVEILHNISLDIKRGEYVMIFGPSGCGKTTLLNTILGLEEPTSGSVVVDNIRLGKTKDTARLRAKYFSTIYQRSNWIKSYDALGNVALPLYLQGLSRSRANRLALKALNQANMLEFSKSHPNEMSSGEQQRIGLARAIVTDAPIIVADEPTGNLDSKSSHNLMQTLKELHKQGKTIILVTHNLAYLSHADTKIAMRDGRIIGHFKENSIPHRIKHALEEV